MNILIVIRAQEFQLCYSEIKNIRISEEDRDKKIQNTLMKVHNTICEIKKKTRNGQAKIFIEFYFDKQNFYINAKQFKMNKFEWNKMARKMKTYFIKNETNIRNNRIIN